MHRFAPIVFTLALAASAAWAADQSPAASSPATSEAQAVAPASEWPAAIRNFWEERASEVQRIGGELWYVRVKQRGEKLPASNIMKQAYQLPAAPNYIRLRDGHHVSHVAYIVAGMELDGIQIGEAYVERVNGDVMNVMVAGNRGYKHSLTFSNLTPEQRLFYEAYVLLAANPLKNRAGHYELHAPLLYRVEKKEVPAPLGQPPRKVIENVLLDERAISHDVITPEELRKWCAEQNISAFPDPRPIVETHVVRERVREYIGNGIRFDTKDVEKRIYTWSSHEIAIPPAAR